uniref:Spermatogenesis-defective protein 39 homolog n=1 Tax=Leptobrachium leishanense TaxID=445787 RepID=A0A8C5QNH8_9ANUR
MSRAKADEDEYWHGSKYKAFTFDDDDDDELSQLKESKRAVNSLKAIVDEEDDDGGKFTWSGEPVGSISWSIQETASNSRMGNETRDFQQKTRTETSFYSIPKPGPTFSNLFKGSLIYNTLTGLFKEILKVTARSVTFRSLHFGGFGDSYCSLERFRSLKEKLQLLDEAVRRHDGNVITAFLFFLEVLFRELECREVALMHFIHFLKETSQQQLLTDLLRFLDRTEELALCKYREHLNINDAEQRRDFLKTKCIRCVIMSHFVPANDRLLESKGQDQMFRKYPRKASLLFMPLVTTLYYSCIYHYTEGEGTFSSPSNLRKTFKIPEKLYILTALGALAKIKAWSDIDALFTTKNWLGYTKKRAPMGFNRVVEILHKNGAPSTVLQDYVRLIEDVETRIALSSKYKCHDVVIDTYKDLKDRQQLMVYRCKVERGSPEEDKIDMILINTVRRSGLHLKERCGKLWTFHLTETDSGDLHI